MTGRLETLADAPVDAVRCVESVGVGLRDSGHDRALGLRRGVVVRVLARFPETAPHFVEVEIGNRRASLPLPLAAQVRVSVC